MKQFYLHLRLWISLLIQSVCRKIFVKIDFLYQIITNKRKLVARNKKIYNLLFLNILL